MPPCKEKISLTFEYGTGNSMLPFTPPNFQHKNHPRYAHTNANVENARFFSYKYLCNEKQALDEMNLRNITVSLYNNLKNDDKYVSEVRLLYISLCIQQAVSKCLLYADRHSVNEIMTLNALDDEEEFACNQPELINVKVVVKAVEFSAYQSIPAVRTCLTLPIMEFYNEHARVLSPRYYEAIMNTVSCQIINDQTNEETENLTILLRETRELITAALFLIHIIHVHILSIVNHSPLQTAKNKAEVVSTTSSSKTATKTTDNAFCSKTEEAIFLHKDKKHPVKKIIVSSDKYSSIESETSKKTYKYEIAQLKNDLTEKKFTSYSTAQRIYQTARDHAIHNKSDSTTSFKIMPEEKSATFPVIENISSESINNTEKILDDTSMDKITIIPPSEYVNTETTLADLTLKDTAPETEHILSEDVNNTDGVITDKISNDLSIEETITLPETDYMYDIPSKDGNTENILADVSKEQTAATPETEYILSEGVSSEEISNDLSMKEATTILSEMEYMYIQSEDANTETPLADHSVEETAITLPETECIPTAEIIADLSFIPKTDFTPNEDVSTEDILTNAAALYDANDFEGMESTLRTNISKMEVISEKFYLLFGIGLALYKKSKHHYAVNEFNEAIALLQQHHIPDCISQQSVVHHYIGEALCAQHHYAEAVECYKQSVKLHRCSNGQKSKLQKLYDLKGLSLCSKLYKTALALRSNDCISEAVEMFKQAIACDDSTVEELIACHSGLGNLFHNNGDYQAAIKEYEKAIELAEKAEDCHHHSRGWIYGNIGNCCLALGKKHEGIQYLHQALEYTNTTDPTPASISRALNNLGTGYQAVGDVETAEDYYDQALCQSIYGEDTNGQARAYGNTGNLCMLRKDYERATLHYTEVLNITNDSTVMYVAYHNRACGYYELAENMKEKLICKDKKISFQFEAYGPHISGGMKSKKETNAKILQMYQQGLADFEKIISNHESKFSTALVSPKGLDLFVCLFESNSKTFRRAQDCAYSLGDHHRALLLAEQCRSRTLAELMMRKRQKKLQKPALHFHSPLTLDQVVSIMHLQEPNVPVVMLSWTGDRLLGWVLVYNGKEVTMDSFEQKPSENMFDGKSLETFLQYCLGQLLSGDLKLYEGKTSNDDIDVVMETCKAEVEKGGITEEERIEEEILNLPPIAKLFQLVAEPMEHVIALIDHSRIIHSKRKIILITDSTTKLIPFSSLHTGIGNDTHVFGDKYTIRFMPSLLTLGIMSQTPPIVIPIPTDNRDACIVGDPVTPPFTFKGHEFILSSLPHAKEEAEWVGHYMRAKPLLQNEPTKYVVTSRIKNSSLIHIASHGSALHGFLVLAGTSYDTQSTLMTKISKAMVNDADDLLLFASDVASLSLNAGLVVLSSCDSSRGVIKGDDIQGMARAFLLAGAQSVMTSLWKVPDKSARFFMQFFYQYLLDGHTGSEALNKASCSIRAFDEFSSMIHWSGYQITGKDVTIQQNMVSDEDRMIKKCLERECSPFPRLEILSALRKSVIEEQSSDIQILCGSADVDLSEPVADFIIQNPGQFPGGIVWINGSDINLLDGQCNVISKILQTDQRSLIVIDSCPSDMMEDALITMNDFPTSSVIMTLLCISGEHLNAQIGTRKRLLTSYNVSALTNLQVTQRIVYHINCSHHLSTRKEEQKSLLYLTSLCHGSPVIIRMMTALIDKYISKFDCPNKGIKQVYEEIKTTTLNETQTEDDDNEMINTVSAILDCHIKEHFISVPSIFLLQCLSLFDAMPIPQTIINAISEEIIASSSTENRILPCEIWGNLCSLSLLRRYPSLPKDRHTAHSTHLYYVPIMVLDVVWETSLADDSVSKFVCGEIINQAMNSVLKGCLNSSSPVDCLYLPELIRNVHKHVPDLDILYELQIIAINIRDHHVTVT